jgi:hypothetical protein
MRLYYTKILEEFNHDRLLIITLMKAWMNLLLIGIWVLMELKSRNVVIWLRLS